MPYSILLYRVRNLGDMIQTLALSRLLPRAVGVYRHRLDDASQRRLLIVNGVLDKDRPPKQDVPCLFAGVSGPHFRAREYLRWMARSQHPIGARDQATFETARAAGLRSELIGCATLTLPRYDGPRSGVYSVDWAQGPGRPLSHRISRRDSPRQQWKWAVEALERYRTAEAVYTSRLHVALPCLAFGTPVWIANPSRGAWQPSRFSLLEKLGVDYETLVTADVSPWARRYVEFLEAHLSRPVEAGEPKMPDVPAGGMPSWFRWMRWL